MTRLSDRRISIGSPNRFSTSDPTAEFIAVRQASAPQPTATLLDELAVARARLEQQCAVEKQLHQALESRDSIGQAKGILMERYKISANAAFDMLQRESSRTNRKLVDVAQCLLYSGEDEGGLAQQLHGS